MNLSEFDYELPPSSIAQRPLGSTRRLPDAPAGPRNRRVERWALPRFSGLLRGDELVVLNNARVLPARLFGHRAGLRAQQLGRNNPARHEYLQSEIEVLLIRQIAPDTWETLVRPGRKIQTGEKIIFGEGELEAQVESRGEFGLRVLRFTSRNGFHEALDRARPHSFAALYQTRGRADGSRALPDRLCPAGKRGRRAHRRSAFHARNSAA